MYKTQMKVQKLLCFLAIIVSVALFIYSLGIMTDLFAALYQAQSVAGANMYYSMQGFNRALTMVSIGLLLLAVLLMITNTHVRRRYYIGNYVAIGLYAVASVAISVWGHIQIEAYKALFLQVDFEALRKIADQGTTKYTRSTFWFDLHYVVFGLILLASVLLIVNAAWKIKLMKEEAALLDGAKG